MRKVLAKNPQVEQKNLHRRIFLDNIDPENQALRVSLSSFIFFCKSFELLLTRQVNELVEIVTGSWYRYLTADTFDFSLCSLQVFNIRVKS